MRSLVGIMRSLAATSADRAIKRPALREGARKVIGDTGLLDHLLKHMVGGGGGGLRNQLHTNLHI